MCQVISDTYIALLIFNLYFLHNIPFSALPFVFYHNSNELNLFCYTDFQKCLVTILLFSAKVVYETDS